MHDHAKSLRRIKDRNETIPSLKIFRMERV